MSTTQSSTEYRQKFQARSFRTGVMDIVTGVMDIVTDRITERVIDADAVTIADWAELLSQPMESPMQSPTQSLVAS